MPPSGREVDFAEQKTEGARDIHRNPELTDSKESYTHSPSVSFADRADCQASATPKNASKGERHPKHFLGLRLIDKTIFCKISLSKE